MSSITIQTPTNIVLAGLWNKPIDSTRWTASTSLSSSSSLAFNPSSSRKRSNVNMPTTITSQSESASSMSGLNNDDSQNAGMISTSRPTSSRSLHPISKDQISSHTRRGSSATTESADSSPTTTASTVDSALTDHSPNSCPNSPKVSTLKESRESKESSADQTPTARSMESIQTLSLDIPSASEQDRSISPNKKARNAKGLSINTAGISTIGTRPSGTRSGQQSATSLPAVSSSSSSRILPSTIPNRLSNQDAIRPFSEPSSPAFIVPQFQQAKRSKLGLTITTPDSRGIISVPQTPLRSMASLPLRTRTSDLMAKLNPVPETPVPLSSMRENDEGRPLFSPSMAPQGGMQLPPFGHISDPTLPTPSFGPDGGMRFPTSGSSESSPYTRVQRPPLVLPRTSFDSPNPSSVVQHTIEHNPSTPLHDLPLSQEAKSPGYPEGPICIYPPGVFLYHQPTRKEARKFDVIINVAREVTNPFLEPEEPEEEESEGPKYKDAGVQCMLLVGPGETIPEPPMKSASSEQSFSSAFEHVPDEDEPETPRAASAKQSDPEYIHLPWEHNSKVYEEWLKICELIDERVNAGKKVLIHCQLGVSRSASLIVAYGIYKNPRLTPDEAREQAKKQSRYIDLNMHFMYELGDFKKLLAEKYPQTQIKRPAGHKGLSRTMTDSVLTMGNNHARDLMTPILDEGEEATAQNQFANTTRHDSIPQGPSSAPNASEYVAPDTSLPSETQSSLEQESQRAGDKTPKAVEPPLKLTLPSIKSTGNENSAKAMPPPEITIPKPSRTSEELKSPPPLQLALPPRSHIQNIAQNTNLLPSPHLEIPNPHTSNLTPRRTLRPMPSLPAGFSSMSRNSSSPHSSSPFPNLKLSIEALKSPTAAAGEELLSPRLQEFTATPFHRSVRSLAGDLAEPSSGNLPTPTPRDHDMDPRSPPTKGEVVVLQSIDDILR